MKPADMGGWKATSSKANTGSNSLSTSAGTFSETQFMQKDKFKMKSIKFFCTSEWVSGAEIRYSDGMSTWSDFVGGSDHTTRETQLIEFDSDESPQGLMVGDDKRFTQSVRAVVTDKRTIEVASCGDSKATPTYKSCSSSRSPSSYFKSGMAGLYGFVEFKGDKQRFRQLGLLCAVASTKDSLVQPKELPPIEFAAGEFLTGFVGVMTAVTESVNKLGGIAAITTNQKVIPTKCGSEIGPRESIAIPMDGMPISLFAKDDGDGSLSGLGIQYVKVATSAENGFILHTLSHIKTSTDVGVHLNGGEVASMKKSFFPYYTNTYLRLVELSFQCVYDGHFSYLSFMSVTYSNKDSFEFGFKLRKAANVFDRTILLGPNENLENLDFFTSKRGVLTGIAGAVTTKSDRFLNCGHGAKQVSLVPPKGYHIVGLNAEVLRSKSKANSGTITEIEALSVPK
jgi:hypothetical protein